MPQLTPAPAPRPARRGITLVEVMVTVVVLGIVGATLTTILTRQQRFYRDAAETVEVRRELRGGSMLLPTDLRAISTVGGDLLESTSRRFTIRATIGSAVVCARGASSVDVVPTDLTTHTLASWYAVPQATDTAFVFDDSTTTGAADDYWWKGAIASTATSTAYCSGSPFIAAADAGLPRTRITFTTAIPATVVVGAVVRITRPVRYEVYRPSATSGWYVGYREHAANVWSATAPVAGPLSDSTGLRFTYFDTTGTLVTPTTAAQRGAVARVGVDLRAAGRTDALRVRNGAAMRDSLTFKIGIRNFR